jgi:hypothetical protein
MQQIFKIAANISTPLMLAGLISAILFFIIRSIVKGRLLSKVSNQHSATIILAIINRLFVLALVAAMLGFGGYVFDKASAKADDSNTSREVYEKPAKNLLTLHLEEISAVDFAPKPETKNISLRFKIVPLSKNKSVPISPKGFLFIKDSTGTFKKYEMDANIENSIVPPAKITYVVLDGLIPRLDYKTYFQPNNKIIAKGILQYEKDIQPTDVTFESDEFVFNASTIRDLSPENTSNQTNSHNDEWVKAEKYISKKSLPLMSSSEGYHSTNKQKLLLYLTTLNSFKLGSLNKKISVLISTVKNTTNNTRDPFYNLDMTNNIDQEIDEIENRIKKEAL